MSNLSPHFTEWEFERSETASRNHISNKMPEAVKSNARLLCAEYLEPIRSLIKLPLEISSGYRSPALNKIIKGSSPTSAHMYGLAVDIFCKSVPMNELFWLVVEMIRYSRLPRVDQLIWEYGTWIHIGIKNPRSSCRGQIICSEKTYFPTEMLN